MHVVHVIDALGLGGAERMLVDIANATSDGGHRVTVCVTRDGLALAGDLAPSIEVIVLGRKTRLAPGPTARFVRWLRATRPDLLHVHMRSSAAYLLLLRLTRLVRVPILFHDHFGSIETDTSIPMWFRVGHRGLAAYVGVSDRLASWAIAAGMTRDRVVMIENRLDLRRLTPRVTHDLRAELGVPPATAIAVLVASLRPAKTIEVAIEALARAQTRARLHLAVVGAPNDPAYAARLRARVERLGLTDHVTFLGGRSDVPALLAAADFAVLCSRSESGPLVLIEYAAAGLPLISTRVGDIGHHFAAHGIPGFVEPDDIDAFAGELDRLSRATPVEREERGARGRRLIDETWDIRGAMARWYRVYEQVRRSPDGVQYPVI